MTSTNTTQFRNTRLGDAAEFEITHNGETIAFSFVRDDYAEGIPTEWSTLIRHGRYETFVNISDHGDRYRADLRIVSAGSVMREVSFFRDSLASAMRTAVKMFEVR